MLLTSLTLTAQEVRELEADLSQTVITDLKAIKKKAEKIFEIDPRSHSYSSNSTDTQQGTQGFKRNF